MHDRHGRGKPGHVRSRAVAGDVDRVVAVGAVDRDVFDVARAAFQRSGEVEVDLGHVGAGEVVDGDVVRPAEGVEVDALDAVGVHGDVAHVADELQMPAVRGQGDVLGRVGAVEDHRVGAVLALDGVAAVTGIPDERVVTTAEVGDVVALAADNGVTARAAFERLGAGSAGQGVVAGTAGDRCRDRDGERAIGVIDARGVVARTQVDVDGAQVAAGE